MRRTRKYRAERELSGARRGREGGAASEASTQPQQMSPACPQGPAGKNCIKDVRGEVTGMGETSATQTDDSRAR